MPAKKRAPARNTDFLSAAKTVSALSKLEIPEMGRTVYVRPLSARQSREIGEACRNPDKPLDDAAAYDEERFTLMLVAASIVDAEGNRLIPPGREEEMHDLPNAIWLRLQQAALAANSGGDNSGKD